MGKNALSDRDLKFGILKCIKQSRTVNKDNLLRSVAGIPSHLEGYFHTEFDRSTNQRANLALASLERDGLIAPTLSDAVNPRDWMELTDAGERALGQHILDDLDEELIPLGSGVCADRDQMWSSFYSSGAKKNQAACHSARELIDHVLRSLAPVDSIKEQSWWVKDKNSTSGITRRHRIEYILRNRMIEFLEEHRDHLYHNLPEQLFQEAHNQQINDNDEYVKDLLIGTELFLKKLLIYSKGYQGRKL